MARRERAFIMRFPVVAGSILARRIIAKEEAGHAPMPFRLPMTLG
jgi:hypothetical protein